MTTFFGSIFKLDIKYVYPRGKTYYYQRKVPRDLLSRYSSQHIKVNLDTSDLSMVARKVTALNKHYESLWDAMRSNASITPAQVRDSAINLLKQYGLKPQPYDNPQLSVDQFIENILEPKRATHAEGDEQTYAKAPLSDYLSEVEHTALTMLNEKPKLLLSVAVDIYIDTHQKKNNETFTAYTRRVWKSVVAHIGDKPFEQVNRSDANLFISKTLAGGSKTTTARRQLSVAKAVFTKVIIERELNRPNPFMKLSIAGLGDDSKQRTPFTTDQLITISKACLEKDDDIRWLLALQIDLGGRIGEWAGLRIEDIHADAEVPYISVAPHAGRSLKTKQSKRDVPLVGMALWAAKRITETASDGQVYAFPRYTNAKACKATNASNTLNDWIRSRDIDHTTHELRHSMRDRLRQANAPKDIQDAVGGWRKEDIGDTYGLGYSLQLLKGWMDKVVLPVGL